MRNATRSPIGAHTFIWSPRWDRTGARHAAAQAAAAGYDLIEIPLLDPSVVDPGDTIRLLEDLGLSCTCSLGLPAAAHLPAAPQQALAFLTQAIRVAAELGSPWLTGALYANIGTLTGSEPTDEELDAVARILHVVAARAADCGVKLGLELINRYETYILNTTDQAVALIDRIDAPNVYAHLDTYHMNIEQPSFTDAIRELGPRLGYIHLADSHRGTIGEGHVPFDEIFETLAILGYDGPLIIEAFHNADPAIRAITATWNDYSLDPQQFAVASLERVAALRDENLS